MAGGAEAGGGRTEEGGIGRWGLSSSLFCSSLVKTGNQSDYYVGSFALHPPLSRSLPLCSSILSFALRNPCPLSSFPTVTPEMSAPVEPGPSHLRMSHIPLVPLSPSPSEPAKRISAQYRFDAPVSSEDRASRVARVIKSLLGLGLRRNSRHRPSLSWGQNEPTSASSKPFIPPSRSEPPSPKADRRKACQFARCSTDLHVPC